MAHADNEAMFEMRLDAQKNTDEPLEAHSHHIADDHPEWVCDDCGEGNVSWHVESFLWNEVCRPPGYDRDPMLCPTCFALRAEKKGFIGHWTLSFERHS
jgi:hypothetical protein